MNDYLSRSEISPVERSVTRAPSAVSGVQPVSASVTGNSNKRSARNATPEDPVTIEADVASSAEYAKVHARIADILADLRSQDSDTTVDGAAEEIQSMLPLPQVLVPLPPASKEAVESSIRIAKRIAEQAAYAHAAQAHVRRGVVDQVVAAGV